MSDTTTPEQVIARAIGPLADDVSIGEISTWPAPTEGFVEHQADLFDLPDEMDERLRSLDPVVELPGPRYHPNRPRPIHYWLMRDGLAAWVFVVSDPDPRPEGRVARVRVISPISDMEGPVLEQVLMCWVRDSARSEALSELACVADRLKSFPAVLGWAATLSHLREQMIEPSADGHEPTAVAPWLNTDHFDVAWEYTAAGCESPESAARAADEVRVDQEFAHYLVIPHDTTAPREVDLLTAGEARCGEGDSEGNPR